MVIENATTCWFPSYQYTGVPIIVLTHYEIQYKLAASPRRHGITVASRLWLCIFKQSLRDFDLTTVASRL